MYRILIFLIMNILFISSCGMLKRGTIPWEDGAVVESGASEKPSNPPTAISAAAMKPRLNRSEREMKKSLDLAYKDWKGVPYVLGGTGYGGVDCSSFMQIVFEDYFQIKLPRNTRQQMREGKSVRKNRIRMGDLVFFKTGRNLYHVGVMVDDKRFLHASTSSGVMISELSQSYWQRNYLTTRRVL